MSFTEPMTWHSYNMQQQHFEVLCYNPCSVKYDDNLMKIQL